MALWLGYYGELSGKLGGCVWARGRGGSIARKLVTPLNPQTPSQMRAREILADCSRAWQTLTDAQREAWTNLAAHQPYNNYFGQSKFLSGIALFCQCNANLSWADTEKLTDAPANLSVRGLSPITVAVTSSVNRTFTVAYEPETIATEGLFVHTAISVPTSISFVKNLYRLNAFLAGVQTSPVTVTSPAELGAFVDGTNLHVRVYRVNLENGAVSVAQESKVVIA